MDEKRERERKKRAKSDNILPTYVVMSVMKAFFFPFLPFLYLVRALF